MGTFIETGTPHQGNGVCRQTSILNRSRTVLRLGLWLYGFYAMSVPGVALAQDPAPRLVPRLKRGPPPVPTNRRAPAESGSARTRSRADLACSATC